MTTHLAALDIDLMVVAAGPAFTWDATTGTSRPEVTLRAGITDFLREYAENLCAFCGEDATTGEVCHLVSGGKGRKGWIETNLAWGCDDCNDIDGARGPVVSFATILRADLVPTSWEDGPTLRARGERVLAAREAARARKAALRGM